MELYTAPPEGSTVICADELGPVIPRTFPPAPGWSPDGHRIKAPLEYSRGPEKTWVYGGLRVADGQAVTLCAPSRNSAFYQDFLQLEEQANPEGAIWVITDNLSSHDSKSTRAWLEDHPRIRHAFIPKRACWLNLQEGWWRIFRRQALAGQDFADPDEIAHATRVATAQLNARARPWVWDGPSPSHRPTADALYTPFKLGINRTGGRVGWPPQPGGRRRPRHPDPSSSRQGLLRVPPSERMAPGTRLRSATISARRNANSERNLGPPRTVDLPDQLGGSVRSPGPSADHTV